MTNKSVLDNRIRIISADCRFAYVGSAESGTQFIIFAYSALKKRVLDHVMVVLPENGHIQHKYGIPHRVFKRTEVPFRTIYRTKVGGEVDSSIADYVWIAHLRTGPKTHMLILHKNQPVQLHAEQPVVIMGRGHSGTRIMAWALVALQLRMGTLEEKHTGDAQDRRFTGTIKKIAQRTLHLPGAATPSKHDLIRFQKSVRKYIQWLGDISPGWGWKFPETYLIGNIVDAVFPRARYIHMIRDGRDLAFKSHLTDDPTRGLGKTLLHYLDAMDKPDHIQAALSWDYQLRRFEMFAAHLRDRVHPLTFEALCSDPVGEIEKAAAFLGIPMTDACKDYLMRVVDPTKASQYRHEDPLKVAEIERLIGETLAVYGYQ